MTQAQDERNIHGFVIIKMYPKYHADIKPIILR